MFRKLKPGVSLRTHYTVAAVIWSGIGLMLMIRGGLFLRETGRFWLLAPALAIGILKALYVLDKSARKNIARLSLKSDGSCLGGIYSPKMWLLILVMMIMGKTLRSSGLPAELIGVVYVAIGCALTVSSRLLWGNLKTYIQKGV